MKFSGKYLVYAFMVCWIVVILLDYYQKHPLFTKAITLFAYYDILALQVFATGAVSIWIRRSHIQYSRWINGASLALYGLLFCGLYLWAYNERVLLQNNVSDVSILRVMGFNLLQYAKLFVVTLVSFLAGRGVLSVLRLKMDRMPTVAISTAFGLVVWTLFTLLLSSIYILNMIVIWQGVVLVLLWQRRRIMPILKSVFVAPLPIQRLGTAGIFGLTFLVFLILFNFMHTGTLYPKGFDSQNFYANIPNLINAKKGLVVGFQPYAWSVFMASGQVMFNDIAVALGLSSMGGMLSLGALYVIGTHYLKMRPGTVLIALLFLLLVPSIGIQMVFELKVDLGLLYIELSTLILLLEWVNVFPAGAFRGHWKDWIFNKYLIIIGMMLGFALSIKLTAIFMFLALPVILYGVRGGPRQSAAAFLVVVAFVLGLKLDDVAGLRIYHQGIYVWIALCLLVFAYLVWSEYKAGKGNQLIPNLRALVIIGFFAFLTFSPWLAKNITETDGGGIDSILNGRAPGIQTNIKEIDRAYRASQNEGG